jgi:hypothetical protein
MPKLSLGVEVRDFDLERMGFSLSVLDGTKRQTSEGYLRMTLQQWGVFSMRCVRRPMTLILPQINEAGLDKGFASRPGPGRQKGIVRIACADAADGVRNNPCFEDSRPLALPARSPIEQMSFARRSPATL